MNVLFLIVLLLVVLLLFVYPTKQRAIDFDEKGEAIKVYQEEVKHLEQQLQKGFIDEAEQAQLLAELDQKSALAITAIEKKTYAYRQSLVPLVLIIVGLAVASLLFYRNYERSGALRWQLFNFNQRGVITEGLFDAEVVDRFIGSNDGKTAAAYCFAMQQELLAKYDTNPDTLANLAQCHLGLGYSELATEAVERGLKTAPQHTELNYVTAEMDFLRHRQLSKASLDKLLLVIKQNPTHFKALRLLGVNSLNQGDYQQAKFFFAELRKLATGNPELLAALDRVDKEITVALGDKTAKQSVNDTVVAPAQSAAEPKIVNSAEQSLNSPASDAKSISATVRLSPDLAKTLKGTQTLFVVVKSAEGGLINATKHLITDVNQPLSITIQDNQAGMMQMQPMAGFDAVSVIARISKNGSPMAASGDLTSVAQTAQLSPSTNVTLVIDQVVP